MNLTVVVPPPFEPLTVAQVYEHMRWPVEATEGSPAEPFYPLEATVLIAITAAREMCESMTRRALVQQTIRLTGAGFCRIELLRPPLIGVVDISYRDGQNVLQTLDPAVYYVGDEFVPRLHLNEGQYWPCLSRRDDAVAVTYQVGYPTVGSPPETQADYVANIPKVLIQGMLIDCQLNLDRFDANEKADLQRSRDSLFASRTIQTFG